MLALAFNPVPLSQDFVGQPFGEILLNLGQLIIKGEVFRGRF
jgi:hypothetical protein